MADFIDVPIDVTAEQIEKMAKRQVDTVAKKGSKNLITSGAVAMVEIDSENILPDAVTNRHLANDSVDTLQVKNGAITKDKIADNSVDYNHLKDMVVTPEKLDREYVLLHSVDASFSTESQFYNYLITGANTDLTAPLDKMCMFSVRNTLGGFSYIIGTGRFYGFYVSKSAFLCTKIGVEPKTFLVIFNAEKITSVERVDIKTFTDTGEAPLDTLYAVDGWSIEKRIGYIRKEIESSFSGLGGNKFTITKVNFEAVTYKALLEAVQTHKVIMFDTFTERFTGAETELNLPLGCYVAFYEHGQIACWHFDSGVLYRLVGYDLFDTGDYKFYVTSSFVELENKVGNIDTALDNIIAIQNSYIGGAD